MKTTLFLLSFISIFIISCGSDNKKTYTISDDHNGTKSPRLKKIITKTTDDNKSVETITRYSYDKNNLLISKRITTTHNKQSNLAPTQTEIIYTYTKDKQLKTRYFRDLNGAINRGGSQTEYTYGDIIYVKTKLPVVDTITIESRLTMCVYKHTYILNSSNFAIALDKVNESCHDQMTGNFTNKSFLNNIAEKEYKIYSIDLSQHTEEYTTYYSQSAIATYNNGLRTTAEYYSTDENNTSKRILEETSKYIYENKPYYFKQSPTIGIDLPH